MYQCVAREMTLEDWHPLIRVGQWQETRALINTYSNCTISAPRTSSLYRVDNPSYPIPQEIGYVPDRFRVRQKVPTSGRILVIIEPTAENEVRSDAHKCTVEEG